MPKSESSARPVAPSSRMLSGFTSRCGAPGREARQHPARWRDRTGAALRLRHRSRDRDVREARGARTSCRTARGSGRHRGIHESRASKRRRRRWAQRHLLAGCGRLLRPLGTAAVFRHNGRRSAGAAYRGSGAAARRRRSVRGATRGANRRPRSREGAVGALRRPSGAGPGGRGGDWGLSGPAGGPRLPRAQHSPRSTRADACVRDGRGSAAGDRCRLALANRGYGARSGDPGARCGNRGAGCGRHRTRARACSLPGITARISSRRWRSEARRREELAFVYGSGPTSFERAIGWVARVALLVATTGVACAAGVISVPGLLEPLLPSMAIGGAATALLAGVVARARTEQRTDPLGERSLRFWRGRFGRVLFRVASVPLTPVRPVVTVLSRSETPA